MKTSAEIWERCPVCRARLKDASECPRCGLDFSPAMSTHEEAENLATCALFDLTKGRRDEAFVLALRATQARSTPESLKAFALAAAALSRFDLALSLWRSIKDLSGEDENDRNRQVRNERV